MKVLLIHNYYQLDGGEDAVVESEKGLLEENGHSVELFTDTNKRIVSRTDRLRTFLSVVYSTESKDKLIKKIKEFQPDVVHVHNFFPLITPSAYDAAIENDIPVIQTLHNYRITCSSALLLRNNQPCEICVTRSAYNAVRYRCYRNSFLGSFALAKMINVHKRKDTWNEKVDVFIALTEFAKTKFIESNVDENKIVVKPNFVRPTHTGESPEHDKVALFVGRLSSEKGIETLLEAWKVDNSMNLPKLKIIGTGPLHDYLVNTADCLDKVEVLGQQPKHIVATEMAKSSCLIFPSIWYEGFPMVIVEALSVGLPIIGSKLGSMQSIIEHGKTGLLFQPNNARDLATKVDRFFSSSKLRAEMRKNCLETYSSKYTAKANYAQLMSIYHRALSSRMDST